jgi:hypothetical protein
MLMAFGAGWQAGQQLVWAVGVERGRAWQTPLAGISKEPRQHHRPADRRPELRTLPSGQAVCTCDWRSMGASRPRHRLPERQLPRRRRPGSRARVQQGWLQFDSMWRC